MTPRRRGRAIVSGWAVVLLVLATAAPTASAAERVRADGRRWRPAHTYISVDERVTWTNPTNRRHDVTAYGGGWSFRRVLDPDEQASFVFRSVRSGGRPYLFRCALHSAIVDGRCEGMCGKVHVFEG
jgi:plastocyanin